MHYRNGRLAQRGDRVFNLDTGHSGILYNLTAQVTTCNGRLAAVAPSDAYVTIADCVHADDVAEAFPKKTTS